MKCPPGWGCAVVMAVLASNQIPLAFGQDQGSVCLAAGAFDAFAKGGATVERIESLQKEPPPSGPPPEAIRFVQVDRRPPVRVTSLRSGKITGIDIIGKHRIAISKRIDMRQPVAQFSFTFRERGSNTLCLSYGSFYGSWMLQPSRGSVCRCKN